VSQPFVFILQSLPDDFQDIMVHPVAFRHFAAQAFKDSLTEASSLQRLPLCKRKILELHSSKVPCSLQYLTLSLSNTEVTL
jgi:hypothetical protein